MPHLFDLLDAAIFLLPLILTAASLPLLARRAFH